MKKNYLLILSAFLLFANLLFAQTEGELRKLAIEKMALKEQRSREHQSVRDYMNDILSRYPIADKEGKNFTQKPKSKYDPSVLSKTNAREDRKSFLMNGNRISVEVYNYGGIGPGYGLLRNVNNFVWRDLGYVFQFCPIIGAKVRDEATGENIYIISDGLNDYTSPMLQEISPTGDTLWQWQPLPGYADPDQPNMASNPALDNDGDGKPDSWPRDWYNPVLGKYVWPGYLSQDATNADLEIFWAMDDRDNKEFNYYPYENDRTKKGLGIQIDGRAFQWSNALAENTIFFVYSVTNVSDKRLDSVFFGIYGDPDLGGGSPENTDDNGFFIPPYSLDTVNVDNIPVYARSMVYFWDPDMKGNFGLPLGYLGCKFLESPGDPDDGIDNDGDGMLDESQDDGEDNDDDWNPDIHDVGVDGIPNTGDEGEGDGMPTAGLVLPNGSPHPLYPGEPNFEYTDLDESDQIGLTSFNSWSWNQDKISNDLSMWNRAIPSNFGAIQQNTDIVFIFGSGYISLDPGETKRISMALLVGEDLDDLLISAEIVQTIYNQNYQFFKPPVTPLVTAVPGDKKVTLYWDTSAEESIDPITGKDFQGYVIYRSTDPAFSDIQKITDGKGSRFLSEPLKTADGRDAKWDVAFRDEPFEDKNGNGVYDAGEAFTDWNGDGKWTANVEDPWEGYHPVPYQKRGVQYYLGDNTGLVHSFVDTNNVINGQTYYYAVVAFDHGDSTGIPPTETTKKITVDPITSQITFDRNTVAVIPGPRPIGYISPSLDNGNVTHIDGKGTGKVDFNIINDLVIPEGGEYILSFSDTITTPRSKIFSKNYSVLKSQPVTEEFLAYDTNFTQLSNKHILNDEYLVVKGLDGTVYTENVDYIIVYDRGSIRRTSSSGMLPREQYIITYRYYPIHQSTRLAGQDDNPVFDGVQLVVDDEDALIYDANNSKWIAGSSNYTFSAKLSSIGALKKLYPGDYEITFSNENIDTAVTFTNTLLRIPVKYTVDEISSGIPQRVTTFLSELPASRNQQWDSGEEIIFFTPGAKGTVQDTLTWGVVIRKPADTLITPIAPGDGDVLLIKTKRPFRANDKFILKTVSGKISNELAKSKLDKIYVVPNPYVGYNVIEPTTKLPGQSRGERRIYFENLPTKCTIRIYSLSGDPVAKIDHDSGIEHGRAYWNLLNFDGFGVAYGVYIAHIDAGSLGEKILKFALIK